MVTWQPSSDVSCLFFQSTGILDQDDYASNATLGEYDYNEYEEGNDYATNSSFDPSAVASASALSPRCPFVATSEMGLNIEWLYKIPVFLLLACNMVFLVWIMAVSFFWP